MKRYFEFAGRTRTLLVTFVATAVFLFLVFPNLPINGEMLDMKPGYSYGEAMAAMEEYGPDGRTTYAWGSMVLDTLFPLVYVTFFAGLIHRFRLTEGTWWLAFVPVVAGVWDLGENVQITAMLVGYPDVGPGQVASASAFTTVKGYIGPVYQILGIGLLLVAAVRGLLNRNRSGDG
ncbi:MAG: hypothetical protein OXQ29_13395 [Rhodospirillaceae bacterium]|nr:hypothetical protein [Rhodospirillaceae bacterium]